MPMDGRDMLSAAQVRSRLLLESFSPVAGHAWSALRTPTSHYIEQYDPASALGIRFREYYDLGADPWELDNLLGDGNPANDPPTAGVSAQLAQDRDCTGATCP
jgi:hypothetical protein